MSRHSVEKRVRRAFGQTEAVGSATLRQPDSDTEHYVVRFPREAVEQRDVTAGEELEQFYDRFHQTVRIRLADGDGRGLPVGSATVRRGRGNHYVTRFPAVAVRDTSLTAGDRLEQFVRESEVHVRW